MSIGFSMGKVKQRLKVILTAKIFYIIMYHMRTTVTLEPETERLLREAMHQRGQSFKETLNQAVTRGLADLLGDTDKTPFVQPSFPMGLRAGHDSAHLNSLNDDMEVDAFLALSRRLSEPPSSE